LIRKVKSTIDIVEQAHSAGSVVMRYHKTLGTRMLRARSVLR